MTSPSRSSQRSLLNAGLQLFTTKLGRTQHMLPLGECSVSTLQGVELHHQYTGPTRMSQRLVDAQKRTQLLEDQNRQLKDLALEKSELFESRQVMLYSRAVDISQELIVTRMRINELENACTQLRSRILELNLRRIERHRLLCNELQMLQQALELQVPTILMRLWRGLCLLWNCVDCLSLVSRVSCPAFKAKSTMDALNLFVAGF